MNYTCFGCKTQYTSTSGTPTGIKWEDGHVCKPMKTRTLDELRQNKTYGYRPPVATITQDMPEATKIWDALVKTFEDNKNDSIEYLNKDKSYKSFAVQAIFRAMNL